MIILITEAGYLTETNETPIEGHRYYMEDADEYTPPMRRLWESLVGEWYKSGCFNLDTIDYYKFRDAVKIKYGGGYDYIIYANPNGPGVVEVNDVDEVPFDILIRYNAGEHSLITKKVGSSMVLNKADFSLMINNTIDAMHEAGVSSPKFIDIINTINTLRETGK